MGLLINGEWTDQWYDTKKTGGAFVREDASFRHMIGSERFPAETGRYHLYISYACPWAHRTVIFRKLKGLEALIPMTAVDPFMGKNGWEFTKAPDPVNGFSYLYQLYKLAKPDYTGRVTVPVLWDKKERTIVNNESSLIIRIFNSAFDALTQNVQDYYPEDLRPQIDVMNDFVYNAVNNGVYKAGFATSQEVYEKEAAKLFAALDQLDSLLEKQRYLAGDALTEADWRLFTTLVRFDPVYVGHFKCNIHRIADYPNLSNYMRELYQMEGIKDTVNLHHIKTHYYRSQIHINPTGVIPLGPHLDYDAPHNRGRFLSQEG